MNDVITKIAEIKNRVEAFKALENELMTAGPSHSMRIISKQSGIEEYYYADVSDLLDMVGTALYELERLEPLLEMPSRGYVRNNFNALLRTLKGEMLG